MEWGWLRLLIWGQSSGLSMANHLAFAHIWSWLRALLGMYVHLSAKMDSSVRVSRRLAGHIMGWCPLPPLTPEDFLCSGMGWEILLTTRMRKMLLFCLLPNQDSVAAVILSPSVSRRRVTAAQPGAHLSSTSLWVSCVMLFKYYLKMIQRLESAPEWCSHFPSPYLPFVYSPSLVMEET